MTKQYVILALIIIIPTIIGIAIINFNSSSSKVEAIKILDFRNADYTCNKILSFYFKFDTRKYQSITDNQWYNEARDKLIDNGCISNQELNDLEFIDICMDGQTIGCELSKLEYPELYKNFNFKLSIIKHFPNNETNEGKNQS